MFYHNNKDKKGCGGQVRIEVTHLYNISAPIRLTRSGLKITEIDLNRKSVTRSETVPHFTCIHCEKVVELEEIKVECSSCFDAFSLEEIFHVPGFGANFCKKHLKKIDEEERKGAVSLEKLFTKIRITI